MARPCGCAGECGCTYVGVNGVTITGSGTTRDPGKVGLSSVIAGVGCNGIMSCVGSRVGPGLRYSAVTSQISVNLSADSGNALIFGTDNGLYSTGGSGSGSDSGATVDGLVAQTTPVIGGSYGAGISLWPEGPIDTYKAALDMELNLIHVPVRRSAEYMMMVSHNRLLGSYNYRYSGSTYDLNLMAADRFWYTPGGDPTVGAGNQWSEPTYAPQSGYFGWQQPDRHGMPRLADVLQLVNRRVVLYLQNMDIGASVNDTPAPIDTLSNMRKVITQYGAQKNVIVGTQFPAGISSADVTSISNGMEQIRQSGIAIAAHINSKAEADALPPINLVTNGYSWVFVSYSVADQFPATVKAYKDAGLKVMLHSVHRQYQYALLQDTTKFGTGGLKGAICFDPVYARSNTRYQKAAASWNYVSPDYGRHSNWSTQGIEGQRDRYRGYTISNNLGNICLDGDVINPGEVPGAFRPSAFWILMGEQCPVWTNPATGLSDSYDIDCGFIWDSLTSDRGRWMGIFFGVPEDRPLYDWTLSDNYTKGYNFQLNQLGSFVLSRYDGGPHPTEPAVDYSLAWDSPWKNAIAAGTEYRVKIRVRPDRIVCGPATQVEGGTNTRVFNAATGSGERWRGKYVYVGRHFFFTVDSTRCRFRNFTVNPV